MNRVSFALGLFFGLLLFFGEVQAAVPLCNKAASTFLKFHRTAFEGGRPTLHKEAELVIFKDWQAIGDARLSLSQDRGVKEINVSTFYLGNDDLAFEAMAGLLVAARSGKKVRFIVDPGVGISNPAMLKFLANQPNFEIKFFNPKPKREDGFLGRIKFLWKMLEFNYRFHEKMWIVKGDNGVEAMFGSSNFKGHKKGAFTTEDKHLSEEDLATRQEMDFYINGGPADDMNSYYMKLWDSDLLVDVRQIDEIAQVGEEEMAKEGANLDKFASRIIQGNYSQEWKEQRMTTRNIRFYHDPLRLVKSIFGGAFRGFYETFFKSEEIFSITTPYLVLTPEMKEMIEHLARKKVRVRVFTNSIESNDVAEPQMAYERSDKEWLLNQGVELFEYNGPLKLHKKTAASGNGLVGLGTINLDPRAQNLNREIFLSFEDKALAEQILADHEELLTNSTRILSKRDCSKMEWTGTYRSWKKRVLIPITLRCLL